MEIINHKGKYYLKTETGYRKIVASTDSSLEILAFANSNHTDPIKIKLPQPSQHFIETFVKEYNKGNTIEQVDVEYHPELYDGTETTAKLSGRLKVNSKNEIIVKTNF